MVIDEDSIVGMEEPKYSLGHWIKHGPPTLEVAAYQVEQ
jgi:hypothetical protein